MSTEIIAEIAARYRAVVPPGLTVRVIPRGVSGIPELGQGEHWRVAIKRQNEAAKAAKALAKRLAEADKAATVATDEAADRAQMFANIAVKVAKPKKPKKAAPRKITRKQVRAAERAVREKSEADRLAEVRSMIAEGLTIVVMAERLGISRSAMGRFAKRHDLKMQDVRKAEANERAEAMAARIKEGINLRDVAAEFGVTHGRAGAILSLHGANVRPRATKDAKVIEAVRKAHADGLSLAEAAKRVGVSATTVGRIMQQNGMDPTQCPAPIRRVVAPKPHAEECARLFNEGKSDREIGLMLGMSRSAVQHARQSIGVYGVRLADLALQREVKAQRALGLSARAIAKALGVGKSKVGRMVGDMERMEKAAR